MEQDRTPPETEGSAARNNSFSDIKKRVISGAVLAPVVIAIIYFGGVFYSALVLLAAIILSFEWKNLVEKSASGSKVKLEIMGLVYILLPSLSLIWLREIPEDFGVSGRAVVFWVILIVWVTDIAGFFAGRHFGGPKLAPAISPGKTWAGFCGALIAAVVLSLILAFFLRPAHIPAFIIVSVLMSVVSQIGDLFESWVKRRFGVKDSGSLIPGHGGLFDRVDGLLAAGVFTALVLAITSGAGIFK